MSTILPKHDAPVSHDARSTDGQSHWLGWAAFLAASWTWCIGMFLPVLLVRDYGLWGWVVFAVPNVLGAAAMGWVIRSPESSRQIAAAHRTACTLFSGVTIAFHMAFLAMVIAPLARNTDLAFSSVIAASILVYIAMTRQRGADRVLAATALVVSALAMIGVVRELPRLPQDVLDFPYAFGRDLLWLAPVCVFGFLGCPYLDLTFHRARQHARGPRAAFGVGFGGFFLIMIVFTLLYSLAINRQMTPVLGILLFIHMAVQSSFTLAAHARELRYNSTLAVVLAGALTLAAWGAHFGLSRGSVITGMLPGELIYRVFMGFYGLIFPAYVWLVMIPGSRDATMKRKLIVYAAAVLIALPMFWMGFVARQMIWLVPGLAVVLLARLLVRQYAKPAGL